MKKLSPYEQLIYDDYMSGLTWAGISVRRRIPYAEVMDVRYEIIKKGYSLDKKAAQAEKHNKEEKTMPGKYTTPEECAAIAAYRTDHTIKETAEKFCRSTAAVARITPAPAAQPEEPPAQNISPIRSVTVDEIHAVPEEVLEAVRYSISVLDKNIEEAKRALAINRLKKEKIEQWLAEVGDAP
ncbi:MAG: hypothetical protein E7511_03150 [Ruminococcus sp.]|nr:hypothetical protein [Ruminococcus sp.]